MAIIGISGRINSGKDLTGTIIQYLVWRTYYTNKEFPPISEKHFEAFRHSLVPDRSDWKLVKYADKLKDILCILLGCTREQLEDRDFKENLLGEEWTKYSIANGFWSHSDGNPSHKMMDSIQCDKETYEAEKRTNWQTAYMTKYTPRVLLQYIGTDLFRKFIHENVWVNATMIEYKSPLEIKTIKDNLKSGEDIIYNFDNNSTDLPNWIITDVRFPNEADAIKQRKGINIRIERKLDYEKHEQFNGDINNPIPTGIFKEHESETTLDNYEFTYVIDNNGTIEELIERVKEILLIEKII